MQLSATHETEDATMLLAYATGGATDTTLIPKSYTWAGLCDRLTSPRVGNKDGSYYIRGGKLKANKRADENLLEAELLILDVDSTFDPVTGEISAGGPPIDDVARVLSQLGYTFVGHTSHSAAPEQGFWKYRIVFPAKMRSQEELCDCLDYIIAQLHGEGVYIADVAEARRWSQPWFLPRVRTEEDKAHFRAVRYDGLPFDVVAALEWAQERKKADAAIHAAKQTAQAHSIAQSATEGAGTGSTSFAAFNDSVGLEGVRNALEAAGYRFGYFDRRQQCYRYMRPGSESRTCGVVVFKGSQGHWCTYSHHGSADPLSGRVCDPFDLITTLQYGGDRKAAARALIPRVEEPSIVEQIAARQAAGEARPMNDSANAEPFNLQPAGVGTSEQSKADKPASKRKIELIKLSELQDVPVRWLVEDILPAASFAAIYGRPGSYKSFVALHIAACVAAGLDCFGKPAEAGPVIYVAGEGAAGLKRRSDALLEHMGLDADLPIYFVKAQLNLRSSLEDYDALCAAIDSVGVRPALVIFDTFARIFAGGEENSAKDVGETIVILGAIQERYQTAVAIIHHAGKDESKGMRGSSALLGAVDTELECIKLSPEDSEDRIGKLTVTKQKDGEDGLIFGYRMKAVNLSKIDPDAVSLAVEPLSEADAKASGIIKDASAKQKRKRLTEAHKKALRVLENVLAESKDTGQVPDLSRSVKTVRLSVWRETYISESTLGRDSAMKAFNRANEALWTSGTISGFGGHVWISKAYNDADK
jgi:hypothetical protein